MLVNLKTKGNSKILQNLHQIIHTSLIRSHNKQGVVNRLAKYLLGVTLRKGNTLYKANPHYVYYCNVQCIHNNNIQNRGLKGNPNRLLYGLQKALSLDYWSSRASAFWNSNLITWIKRPGISNFSIIWNMNIQSTIFISLSKVNQRGRESFWSLSITSTSKGWRRFCRAFFPYWFLRILKYDFPKNWYSLEVVQLVPRWPRYYGTHHIT